jgi:voltage-gated potassium channel
MKPSRECFGLFQLLIMVLSVYVLVQLLVEILIPLSNELLQVFQTIDTLICIIFIIDFGLSVKKAKKPMHYIFRRWGWVDLVSSIPMVGPLRAGRALRLVRLIRLLRAGRSTKHLISSIFANRANSTLFVVATACTVLACLPASQFLILKKQNRQILAHCVKLCGGLSSRSVLLDMEINILLLCQGRYLVWP